jgi:hypothetical protein
MQIRSSFKSSHPACLRSPADFRLHAKRQEALILEAAARQERAKARQMNLAVARQAVLLVMTIVFAVGLLIGLIGQPDLVSIGFWK